MVHQLPRINLMTGAALPEPFTPVRIICVGRNYAEHAREMGHDPEREAPFFFFKPLTALALGGTFSLPDYSQEVHYELELLVALGRGGRKLDQQQAGHCVVGFGLGLDMTCRDLQRQVKAAGLSQRL